MTYEQLRRAVRLCEYDYYLLIWTLACARFEFVAEGPLDKLKEFRDQYEREHDGTHGTIYHTWTGVLVD